MLRKEDLENMNKAELIDKLLSLQAEYDELYSEKLDCDNDYEYIYREYETLCEEKNQLEEDIQENNIIFDVKWFKFILDRYNLLTDDINDFIDFYMKNINKR